MLTLALKFFFEKILPSVLATVTAAYIVNHYIVDRPAGAPLTAAAPAADKADSSLEAGVRTKGVSKKAAAKAEAEKVQFETAAAKPAEKRPEAAGLLTDAKKHQTTRREKAAAKITSTPAAPSQAAPVPDDRRDDANDLARAAIDRLRGTDDALVRVGALRPQSEAARPQQDTGRQPVESTSPRLQEATRAESPPAMHPLPPAIQVSAPAVETLKLDATGMEPRFNRADNAR
ncbi:MAG TPA: hypothetical protein VFS91_07465, partial [Nitrobacter sp.]|nr:hypothetical protein [Nitrobacter sp.]